MTCPSRQSHIVARPTNVSARCFFRFETMPKGWLRETAWFWCSLHLAVLCSLLVGKMQHAFREVCELTNCLSGSAPLLGGWGQMSLLLRRPPGREAYPGEKVIESAELIHVIFKFMCHTCLFFSLPVYSILMFVKIIYQSHLSGDIILWLCIRTNKYDMCIHAICLSIYLSSCLHVFLSVYLIYISSYLCKSIYFWIILFFYVIPSSHVCILRSSLSSTVSYVSWFPSYFVYPILFKS